MRQVARLVRAGCAQVETHRAVDRTLLDGVLAEDAVLRIHPRALGAVAFLAVGPRADAVVGTALTADHEVAVGLVCDHPTMARLIEDGVADVRALDEPVVMKEDASDAETG